MCVGGGNHGHHLPHPPIPSLNFAPGHLRGLGGPRTATISAAHANWKSLDESIQRYTALIRQRAATSIRALFRDRVLYHNETVVRAFWERDHEAVVQVLGTRSEYPGRQAAIQDGDLDWLEDLSFDRPFDPGSDRLLFGIPDEGNLSLEPEDDEYWLAHPLAGGADSLYRFRSGDTLTLSLPDGRRLRAIQLDVLPRQADANRISGVLWIEPESGALVRAVYRLSREFDAMRDIPDLEREEERGTFRFVPGLFRPWTFDITVVAVNYSLWEFKAWLPHSMRIEGEAAAGILKIPVTADISYDIESVALVEDEVSDPAAEADQPFTPPLKEVHFETRAEAMAFIAQLLSEDEPVEYQSLDSADQVAAGRSSLLIVPKELHLVAESPHLPPPIWEDAIGFPSDSELERFIDKLADLPAPSVAQAAFGFHWGWARPDLIRYNRVEGPALGGRLERTLGRRFSLGTSGFFGLADLRPKVRVDLERSTMRRRLTLGAFHELRPTDPSGRYLDFGNSLNAFFFGRDSGEYFRATGGDFTWRPPDGARESFTLRVYAERQSAVENGIDFALFRAFDGDGTFRPSIEADHVEEAGAEVRLAPWLGNDPGGVQLGVELHGRWATWRAPGEEPRTALPAGQRHSAGDRPGRGRRMAPVEHRPGGRSRNHLGRRAPSALMVPGRGGIVARLLRIDPFGPVIRAGPGRGVAPLRSRVRNSLRGCRLGRRSQRHRFRRHALRGRPGRQHPGRAHPPGPVPRTQGAAQALSRRSVSGRDPVGRAARPAAGRLGSSEPVFIHPLSLRIRRTWLTVLATPRPTSHGTAS